MTPRLAIRIAPCALALLAGCGAPPPLEPDVEPIGDFRLGYNIVIAEEAQQAPASRAATDEELETAVRSAMEARLGRYDGAGLYHVGLKIQGYSLGRAGIPIVFTPRSALIVDMNVWDDATQVKLTDEPIRITAFEGAAGPLTGSGLYRSRDAQLEALAFDTAKEVEELLRAREADWFAPKEGRERIAFERDPATGLAAGAPAEGSPAAEPSAGEASAGEP